MDNWDNFYTAYGIIDTEPESILVELVPRLKHEGIVDVLDAGCGTGRNSIYLAKQGFNVHGVDISERAIEIAKSNRNGQTIDYQTAGLADLPYPSNSMDFVFAIHSVEYSTRKGVSKIIRKLDYVLRPSRPILLCVDSTRHPFNGINPSNINEISHIAYSMRNGYPIISLQSVNCGSCSKTTR